MIVPVIAWLIGSFGWRSPGAAADPEAELSRALTALLGR
jgi:hypothetical protein